MTRQSFVKKEEELLKNIEALKQQRDSSNNTMIKSIYNKKILSCREEIKSWKRKLQEAVAIEQEILANAEKMIPHW